MNRRLFLLRSFATAVVSAVIPSILVEKRVAPVFKDPRYKPEFCFKTAALEGKCAVSPMSNMPGTPWTEPIKHA